MGYVIYTWRKDHGLAYGSGTPARGETTRAVAFDIVGRTLFKKVPVIEAGGKRYRADRAPLGPYVDSRNYRVTDTLPEGMRRSSTQSP